MVENNDNKIISLILKYGSKNKEYIQFLDSYLKLPGALKDLAIAFDLDKRKGMFPHKFVTKDNLNYIGPAPGIEYYPVGSFSNLEEYEKFILTNYPDGIFNLKSEALKYCLSPKVRLFNFTRSFNKI